LINRRIEGVEIKMNYIKIYLSLVKNRIYNPIENNEIGENHHIFPQSIFGKNKRIVRLTVREHFVAHKLLYKICYKRYGKSHNKTIKMLFAIKAMMNMNKSANRKNVAMILPSKMLAESRQSHPTMSQEVRDKISMSNKGKKRPSLDGENNPAKRPENRQKISKSKIGKSRPDMKGKIFFGADEETISNIKKKISNTRTGKSINYPSNRKSSPCSEEKASKISESRMKTKQRFIDMSDSEFEEWISKQNLYAKDNKRKNSNVTRVLMWRGINQDKYYKT